MLKPLEMALGLMAACAAWKPQYRGVIYAFAGLFLVRAGHRIIFGNAITEILSRRVRTTRRSFLLAAVVTTNGPNWKAV